jgi:hypothetical protein
MLDRRGGLVRDAAMVLAIRVSGRGLVLAPFQPKRATKGPLKQWPRRRWGPSSGVNDPGRIAKSARIMVAEKQHASRDLAPAQADSSSVLVANLYGRGTQSFFRGQCDHSWFPASPPQSHTDGRACGQSRREPLLD